MAIYADEVFEDDHLPPPTPLDREALRDVIDLSLWAGQLLLHHGAPTQTVEETIHHLGTGLGCNWLDILVSPNAIIATTTSGEEFRTKLRRVVSIGVDLSVVDAVAGLSRAVFSGAMDRIQLRKELERLDTAPPVYSRWLVVTLVGLACGSFCRLFGGNWTEFGVTWVASSAAMFTRQELDRRHFNAYLIVMSTAFVAGLVASSAALMNPDPENALAAAVLLLVPGVPLINAAEDIIEGHMVTGIVRGVTGGVISLALALGLLIALRLTGVGLS